MIMPTVKKNPEFFVDPPEVLNEDFETVFISQRGGAAAVCVPGGDSVNPSECDGRKK